jgi:hypothetical protein
MEVSGVMAAPRSSPGGTHGLNPSFE